MGDLGEGRLFLLETIGVRLRKLTDCLALSGTVHLDGCFLHDYPVVKVGPMEEVILKHFRNIFLPEAYRGRV